MIITRKQLVKAHACSEGLEFFDKHFPAGKGTQEEVFEAIAKYAPTTTEWQVWLARKLRLTATCRTWYSDGTPRVEETYAEGILHGLRRTWYANGKPHVEELYVEGKLHGLRRTWWDDGKPWVEELYVEGKRHGHRRYWYADVKPPVEETWDHGKLVSIL